MPARRLIADIGGTNARFALTGPDGGHGPVTAFRVRDHPGFVEALFAFLEEGEAGGGPVTEAAIAAAGPVRDGAVALTNAPWRFSAEEVSVALGGVPVLLLNDLEAVALALPRLGPEDLATVAPGGSGDGSGALLAINVGTGFGAAVAVPVPGVPGGWTALATEAGHMRLAATSAAELDLFAGLETVEEVLSGPGLAALSEREAGRSVTGAFSDLLGRIAGDLVLATGAWGGVHFCGGVLADWDRTVDTDRLVAAFCRKGPMSARMVSVPLRRIVTETPALTGLAHAPIGPAEGP